MERITPFQALAIEAFKARNPNEVNLEPGKIYTVVNNTTSTKWWGVELAGGKLGWFPCSLVVPLENNIGSSGTPALPPFSLPPCSLFLEI